MTQSDTPKPPPIPDMKDATIVGWGDGYLIEWPQSGWRVEFHRIRDQHGLIKAEYQWFERDKSADETWLRQSPVSSINLLAGATVRSEGKALINSLDWADWNFLEAMEAACDMVVEAHRRGAPVRQLSEIAEVEEEQIFLLPPYIPDRAVIGLYAEPESGKSTIARGFSASIASGKPFAGAEPRTSGPVLYLDWETDERRWARGMLAICRGMGLDCEVLPVFYRKMSGPLVDQIGEIRTEVARRRAKFVVIDSVAWAAGGQDMNDAATATALMDAIASLGVAALVLGHQAKNAMVRRGAPATEFGSVFFRAGARYVWHARGRRTDDGLFVHLVHRKNNDGPLAPEQGILAKWTEIGTVFEAAEIKPERSMLRAAILRALEESPWQKISSIAELIEAKTTDVRNALKDMAQRGEVEAIQRWNLGFFALGNTTEPCFLCVRPLVAYMPDGARGVCQKHMAEAGAELPVDNAPASA